MHGDRAARMIAYLLTELSPFFPQGQIVELTRSGGGRLLTLRRVDEALTRVGDLQVEFDQSGRPISACTSGVTFTGFGSWIPLLPRRLRARLVAQDAVEGVLGTAWGDGESIESTFGF